MAIFFELTSTISLKFPAGSTKPIPTVLMIVAYLLAMWLVSLIVIQVPIGTVYAIWAGLDIAGTAVICVVLFRETPAPRD
jgi:multidrug transporter EmrE-like cation transporter